MMAEACEGKKVLLEKVQKNVRSVLLSSPKGVRLSRFCYEYRELVKEHFPWRSLGYASASNLLRAMPTAVRFQHCSQHNELCLYGVADSNCYMPSWLKRFQVDVRRESAESPLAPRQVCQILTGSPYVISSSSSPGKCTLLQNTQKKRTHRGGKKHRRRRMARGTVTRPYEGSLSWHDDRDHGVANDDRGHGVANDDRGHGVANDDRDHGVANDDRDHGVANDDRDHSVANDDRDHCVANEHHVANDNREHCVANDNQSSDESDSWDDDLLTTSPFCADSHAPTVTVPCQPTASVPYQPPVTVPCQPPVTFPYQPPVSVPYQLTVSVPEPGSCVLSPRNTPNYNGLIPVHVSLVESPSLVWLQVTSDPKGDVSELSERMSSLNPARLTQVVEGEICRMETTAGRNVRVQVQHFDDCALSLQASVLLVDTGHTQLTPCSKLFALPPSLSLTAIPPLAMACQLGGICSTFGEGLWYFLDNQLLWRTIMNKKVYVRKLSETHTSCPRSHDSTLPRVVVDMYLDSAGESSVARLLFSSGMHVKYDVKTKYDYTRPQLICTEEFERAGFEVVDQCVRLKGSSGEGVATSHCLPPPLLEVLKGVKLSQATNRPPVVADSEPVPCVPSPHPSPRHSAPTSHPPTASPSPDVLYSSAHPPTPAHPHSTPKTPPPPLHPPTPAHPHSTPISHSAHKISNSPFFRVQNLLQTLHFKD